MKVEVKILDQMTAHEWYQIAEERIKVFVVERECPYQGIDQQNYSAHHLMLKNDQRELVVATPES